MAPEGVVRELSSDYKQDFNPFGADGVGGTFIFTFEAVSEGQATLMFYYLREWENGDPVNYAVYRAIVDARGNLALEELWGYSLGDMYNIPS